MLTAIRRIFPNTDKLKITDEFKYSLDLFEKSSDNFFLTGNAGTGKSTLVNLFRSQTAKKVAVLAPTGMAAINVRGQTIHSFFKLPPRMITEEVINQTRSRNRIYKTIDTYIIDEASMVRADLLDGIDLFLRRFGRNENQPFGGAQMILVGDLFQLPPVVTYYEREALGQLYETPYFFSAQTYPKARFSTIELSEIFRQNDKEFIDTLNNIRVGEIDTQRLEQINTKVNKSKPRFAKHPVTLTSTNSVADTINLSELKKLSTPEETFEATIKGKFPTQERTTPAPIELTLRKNARVMFVKNGAKWVNGSLGKVVDWDDDSIQVKLDESGEIITTQQEKWEYIRYVYDQITDKVEQEVLGSFHQFPLRLAWAITIHKSQGMTFDKVRIDYSQSPFTHGQTYVALSRCRNLNGLSLSKQIFPNDVIVDDRIVQFLKTS